MHLTTAATLFAAAASATPFKFPLSNGFPHLSPKALAAVEKQAGGTLPNTPLPKKLSKTAIATFQLVAAQETFEVAFFSDLINNVTAKKPGFTLEDMGSSAAAQPANVLAALRAIRAQEELHATGANAILKSAGAPTVPPCEYIFPTTTFTDAIALANTFTDVVLGTLPGAQVLFGEDGGDETGLVLLVGSILGQEAEQNGFYRLLTKKKPSAAPFLTGSTPEIAYSALKEFIVPGSCKLAENIPIPSFDPITVLNPPANGLKDTVLKMEVPGKVTSAMSVTYLSGQNLPVTVPITNIKASKSKSTFSAKLPFNSKGFANGLTLGLVTKGAKKFSDGTAATAAAVYGPALIEVK